jgi:TatD DNase family protein
VVDTHAHLSVCEPPDSELVAVAAASGVGRILTVGMTEQTNREAIAAAEAHEGVFAAVGRHPNEAGGFDDAAAAEIERLAEHPRVAAIGETGLDFYRDYASRADQERAFRAQIGIARRAGKPLVIHMRDSTDETFALLGDEAGGVAVILHCFSAAPERVAEAAERGWYCSFAGNVTYPKSGLLREAAQAVPDELLLVETDAPFLSPQPMRGQPNEPANVVATAECVAAERGVGYAELEASVEANAARVFGW